MTHPKYVRKPPTNLQKLISQKSSRQIQKLLPSVISGFIWWHNRSKFSINFSFKGCLKSSEILFIKGSSRFNVNNLALIRPKWRNKASMCFSWTFLMALIWPWVKKGKILLTGYINRFINRSQVPWSKAALKGLPKCSKNFLEEIQN